MRGGPDRRIALLLEHHRPRHDDGERVVELMRDPGQQRAQRRELFALVQGFALARELLRGAFLLGDVTRNRQHVRLALVLHRDPVHLDVRRRAVPAPLRHLDVKRFAGRDRAQELRRIRWSRPAAAGQRGELVVAVAVHPPECGVGVDDFARFIPQRQSVDRRVEHGVVLLLARPQCRLGLLAPGDVARQRENAVAPADGHAAHEHLVPAQRAVLAPPVPFDAELFTAGGARDDPQGVLMRERALARAERADVEVKKLLAGVAEREAGLAIDVHDRARVDVVHEDRILGGIEYRAVARLRHPERLVGALSFGDVVGNGQRHRVECAAQPAELVGPLQVPAGRRDRPPRVRSTAPTSRAVRRVSRKWNTSHMARASAVTHPAQ